MRLKVEAKDIVVDVASTGAHPYWFPVREQAFRVTKKEREEVMSGMAVTRLVIIDDLNAATKAGVLQTTANLKVLFASRSNKQAGKPAGIVGGPVNALWRVPRCCSRAFGFEAFVFWILEFEYMFCPIQTL